MDGRVLLADNRDIPLAAFVTIDQLRQRLRTAVDQRQAVIGSLNLDPLFCMPDANWQPDSAVNDFASAYRHLRDGGYQAVNRLRFWSQVFTSYRLMSLEFTRERPSVAPIPDDFDARIAREHPGPDKWVRRWRKLVRGIPRRYLYAPKPMLGEIGWMADGVLVNHDTYAYQERLNLLYIGGVFRWLEQLGRPARILEIGGGYGALCYAMRTILPTCSYVICDLPESLMFSGLYLAATLEEPRLIEPEGDLPAPGLPGSSLLPNYLFHRLPEAGSGFDLVINTLSMSEMSVHQINVYCGGISQLIGQTGVFFEQNQDSRRCGLQHAEMHVGPHFAAHRRIKVTEKRRRNGMPNLWANVDVQQILGSAILPQARYWAGRLAQPLVRREAAAVSAGP